MRIATATPTVELRPKHQGVGVFALRRIEKGEEVSRVRGEAMGTPTRHTLQADDSLHLDLGDSVDARLNHSCSPNAAVGFLELPELVIWALRDIEPGEEVCINYCASEEKMAEPFQCNCDSPGCYGTVMGFAYLDPARQAEIGGLLSPFLQKKHGTGREPLREG
jgi:SET domain-containing protein